MCNLTGAEPSKLQGAVWHGNPANRNAIEPDSAFLQQLEAANLLGWKNPASVGQYSLERGRQVLSRNLKQRAKNEKPRKVGGPVVATFRRKSAGTIVREKWASMNYSLRQIILRPLVGLTLFIAVSRSYCIANEVNKEANLKELAEAFVFSVQLASAHLEQGENSSIDERKLQAELLVARIFRLWMSEKDNLDVYPQDFFKGLRVAMGGSLGKLGLDGIYADPLRSVMRSYKISPLVDQKFGRPPDTISLTEFMEKPEIYRKCVSAFLRDLGLDETGK
jgi:hypothetical protein